MCVRDGTNKHGPNKALILLLFSNAKQKLNQKHYTCRPMQKNSGAEDSQWTVSETPSLRCCSQMCTEEHCWGQ